MNRQDATSILITFVIGFIAGSYFYMTGSSFKSQKAVSPEMYTSFVIEGESYGNCQSTDGCLSFQLLDDGSYVALLDDDNGKKKTGDIPSALNKELHQNITRAGLERQSKRLINSNCSFNDDDINYTFNITIEGEEYMIDTCDTAVIYSSADWLALAKLWNYFQTLK